MNLRRIFDSIIDTRPTTVDFHRKEQFDDSDLEYINYIEERTGLSFKRAYNSNSYYSGDVRISDHPNGFGKKNECYYFSQPVEYVAAKINRENPFEKFSEGDSIYHDSEMVGECRYVSYNEEKEYVVVEFQDGTIHKIDEIKFANNKNF